MLTRKTHDLVRWARCQPVAHRVRPLTVSCPWLIPSAPFPLPPPGASRTSLVLQYPLSSRIPRPGPQPPAKELGGGLLEGSLECTPFPQGKLAAHRKSAPYDLFKARTCHVGSANFPSTVKNPLAGRTPASLQVGVSALPPPEPRGPRPAPTDTEGLIGSWGPGRPGGAVGYLMWDTEVSLS